MEPRVLLGKYQLGSLLGRGSFAKVFHARSLSNGTNVAIKVINKSSIKNTTMEPRIIREVSAMHKLNHPNIIRIHEVMATKKKIHLVMEYAAGGELFSKIDRDGRFPEPIARRYFQQLVSALRFCHVNGITHRDIKPQNLLLDHEGNLKISDFGLSALPEQLKDGLLHTACGTPAYTAPEVIGYRGYDGTKSDAWSCGIILFEFLAGYLPFDCSNILAMYRKIYRREFKFPSWFSESVRSVISRLLDPNPETRMSIEELMDVDWFKNSLQPKCVPSPFGFDTMLPEYCKFDSKTKETPELNAFDIISMSRGLDLSALFEGGRKKEKRFTTTSCWEKIVEQVEETGRKLGCDIKRSRRGGEMVLEKEGLIFSNEVLEVSPSLFLVKLKVDGGEGRLELEEAYWEDLKAGLEGMAFSWQN
ncbi:Protein kinase domain [Macleaya cordata]|uniref:non-specific serine/threonine protein kinase n=1 Tax=Macleaya cordata TaxID=56857 RepID=A0A200QH87_MACCD|nr:Protein kinase domain [Macleaya cordata]